MIPADTNEVIGLVALIVGFLGVLVGLFSVLYGRRSVQLGQDAIDVAKHAQLEEQRRRRLESLAAARSALAVLERFEPQVRSGQTQQVYHEPRGQLVQALSTFPIAEFPMANGLIDDEGYAHMRELLPLAIQEVRAAMRACGGEGSVAQNASAVPRYDVF